MAFVDFVSVEPFTLILRRFQQTERSVRCLSVEVMIGYTSLPVAVIGRSRRGAGVRWTPLRSRSTDRGDSRDPSEQGDRCPDRFRIGIALTLVNFYRNLRLFDNHFSENPVVSRRYIF